jgi:folylpolyglutamate synthase/dihydropteroate synthase
MVMDVAHNPAGAWALRSALSERYEDRPLIFVFGAMRDKAISEMTEILFPLAERVIATRPENPRAASPEEIQQAAPAQGSRLNGRGRRSALGAGTNAGATGGRRCRGHRIDLPGGRSDAGILGIKI